MGKSRQSVYFGVGVVLLAAVVTALLVRSARLTPVDIVLPEDAAGASLEGEDAGTGLDVVEIDPQTVGAAIAALDRPAAYSRTQTAETFWSGGSGRSVSQIYVSGGAVRLDTAQADGSVRHVLVSGGAAALWYDDEKTWTALAASEHTADGYARMPSYEDAAELDPARIAAADYRERDGVACVYVETFPDGDGYADRWWVAADWGLLYAAERDWNGELIYRFTAGAPESGIPDASLFLLPDGSAP